MKKRNLSVLCRNTLHCFIIFWCVNFFLEGNFSHFPCNGSISPYVIFENFEVKIMKKFHKNVNILQKVRNIKKNKYLTQINGSQFFLKSKNALTKFSELTYSRFM